MKRSAYTLTALLVFTLLSIYFFWDRENLYPKVINPAIQLATDVYFSQTSLPSSIRKVRNSTCSSPVGNIVFVKTHKTGSTTVRGILNRYGLSKNLSFLLRKDQRAGHIISDLAKIRVSSFLPPLGVQEGDLKNYKGYNISNTHMRFNRKRLEELMNPNSYYITILRHPVDQWLSAFQYFHIAEGMGASAKNMANPVKGFLRQPKRYRKVSAYAWNNQMFDLGVSSSHFENLTYLKMKIEQFLQIFDLVLITEYFDESLVVLKRMLCWTFEDIAYVKMRAQPVQLKASPKTREQIWKLNEADAMLYTRFNRSLWEKIDAYGADFEKDLQYFRKYQNQKFEECVGGKETVKVAGSHQNVMYTLKKNTPFCKAFVNHGNHLSGDVMRAQQSKGERTVKLVKTKAEPESTPKINTTLEQKAAEIDQRNFFTNASTVKDKSQCTTSQGNIVFVKTHKTGSTTLTAILNRYGFSRNLSFLLMAGASTGHFNYKTPTLSKGRSVFRPPIGVKKGDFTNYRNYNISAVHIRYSRKIMEALVFHGDLYYISILREPVSQFLSAFQYFELEKKYLQNVTSSSTFEEKVLTFLDLPSKVFTEGPFTWNNQIFDLGFSKDHMKNITSINQYISKLSAELDLFLIMEYFDESLILLKKLLCWEYEDIIYIKRRAQPSPGKISNPSTIDRIRLHNNADWLLYSHFNKTLWSRIAAYGPSFQDDLETFRYLSNSTLNGCIKGSKVIGAESGRPNVLYIPVENATRLCYDVIDSGHIIAGIKKRQNG
ncbi:Galactosylceramide sulfotransferase [Holothuria leucospilota]|uniref:Galactosylceramide sulfotransferase n=1 Tax=Holothuria leucospilota TaxID=206669 RepID=A0A9Q0YEJ8_HOLLE|nr:Galactosylceramide sulfotransferase [Holothuria leucospilota]